MKNWIDLNNLPKRDDGKISWKDCNNNKVYFSYKDVKGEFNIIKRLKRKRLLIDYEGIICEVNSDSLLKCELSSFVRFSNKYYDVKNKQHIVEYHDIDKTFSYNIGDVILGLNSEIIVLDKMLINDRFFGYKCINKSNNHLFLITNYALRNHLESLFVRKNGIQIGVNDLWTVRPDIATLLYNPEDGFLFREKSNKKAIFMCPKCQRNIGEKTISSVSARGISCPYCGDGISYPNKLMANILSELNVCYEREYNFDWCLYPKYNNPNVKVKGIYDFVINELNLIIEMDGGLGHGKKVYPTSVKTSEETLYNDKQKDLLAHKHNYTVVRIDCDYKNDNIKFEYCKNNIIKSLNGYFDFSGLNWEEINNACQNSKFIEAINLYNKHNYSPMKIAEILNLKYSTINKYLHRGEELGMCKYFTYIKY